MSVQYNKVRNKVDQVTSKNYPVIDKFNTYTAADSLYVNTEVSVNELQRMSEATRGQFAVYSANFCAKNPPKTINK